MNNISLSCSYLEECGGCHAAKGERFKHFIQRKGERLSPLRNLLGEEKELILPTQRLAYRRKVEWRLRIDAGRLRVGYFRKGSRDFLAISRCLVLSFKLEKFLQELQELRVWPEGSYKARLMVQEGRFGLYAILYPSEAERSEAWLRIKDDIHGLVEKNSLNVIEASEKGGCYFPEEIQDRRFLGQGSSDIDIWHPLGGFMQSHLQAEEMMQNLLWQKLHEDKVEALAEFFSGNGQLTLGYPGAVRGFESCERAVALAQKSAQKTVRKHSYSVRNLYTEEFTDPLDEQVAVVDPPRQGLQKLAFRLAEDTGLQSLYYFSCNPESLYADLQIFLAYDWHVEEWKALDLFPWTDHWECFVVLKR